MSSHSAALNTALSWQRCATTQEQKDLTSEQAPNMSFFASCLTQVPVQSIRNTGQEDLDTVWIKEMENLSINEKPMTPLKALTPPDTLIPLSPPHDTTQFHSIWESDQSRAWANSDDATLSPVEQTSQTFSKSCPFENFPILTTECPLQYSSDDPVSDLFSADIANTRRCYGDRIEHTSRDLLARDHIATPLECSGSLRKLEELEVEQDSLNHSLLALTSHFAQVQFRLKQIVESDAADRDSLLKELERFAFDGCQDLPSYDNVHDSICSTFEKRLAEQKAKHEELIFQLKFQLKDLEHYAKQTSEVKAHEQIRRHKLVLDQIKNYLKIDISDLYTLPPDQLQEKVDAAVQDIMAPMRSKEQMLHQLTTQVQDLERFIEFLHGTGKTPNAVSHEIRRCTCDCPLHGEPARAVAEPRSKVLRKEGIEFLSKTLLMFQVIVINSLRMIGCQWQVPEKVPSFMHQVRRLEESVDNFLRFYNNAPHSDEYQEVLLDMVRKKISLHLKILLGHGLKSAKSRDSFALVSCASKARGHAKASHPWSMLTEFYSLQHGKSFTEQPQYQLSQSFGLRIQRESINSKQSLLSCIHKVRESHEPYKRSSNAKFKALIAHGINDGALAQWIRILATSDTLLQLSYEPWSYMTNHGFKEGIKILERLSQVKCNIPTDVALRMFYIPSGTETPLE